MPKRGGRLARVLAALVLAGACATSQELTPVQAPETPLIAKGRALFNDPNLSGDGMWSCASCHPNHGHTNNKTYVGVDVVPDGDPKGRSTPTLWGVGTRHAFSWAGTAQRLALEFAGPEHILAGSDYPHQIGSPASMLASIRALGLPPADTARILGGNARELLDL